MGRGCVLCGRRSGALGRWWAWIGDRYLGEVVAFFCEDGYDLAYGDVLGSIGDLFRGSVEKKVFYEIA